MIVAFLLMLGGVALVAGAGWWAATNDAFWWLPIPAAVLLLIAVMIWHRRATHPVWHKYTPPRYDNSEIRELARALNSWPDDPRLEARDDA